jgi:hypothetical protein
LPATAETVVFRSQPTGSVPLVGHTFTKMVTPHTWAFTVYQVSFKMVKPWGFVTVLAGIVCTPLTKVSIYNDEPELMRMA